MRTNFGGSFKGKMGGKRSISSLSKKLKIKKSGKRSKIFYDEGFGEILDICDNVLNKREEKETEIEDEDFSSDESITVEPEEKLIKGKHLIDEKVFEARPKIMEPCKKEENSKKSLHLLFNKLSDKNMNILINEFKIILENNGFNNTLMELSHLINRFCIQSTRLPDRILLIYVTFISCLHFITGNELLCSILQSLIKSFDDNYSHLTSISLDTYCQNSVIVVCFLFYFNNIGFTLIKQLLSKFLTSFTEHDIEMILLIFKYCGFEIRKKETAYLKDFIQKIHENIKKQESISLRASFMLDVITAVQNNNPSKITDYDPALFESFGKIKNEILKNHSVQGTIVDVSLEVLRDSDASGKWWISNAISNKESIPIKTKPNDKKWDNDLIEAAKDQRYTDPLKIDIFCTLMTSKNSDDAFNRLLNLKLKLKDSHHIVRIVLETCLQETVYNVFYFQLIKLFINHHRSYLSSLQFCIWDQMRKISDLTDFSSNNLISLVVDLFSSKNLELKIFKIISFNKLTSDEKQFFAKLFHEMVLRLELNVLKSLFDKINNEKWSELNENILFFIISNHPKDSPIINKLRSFIDFN